MKRKILRHVLFIVGALVIFVAIWPIVVGGKMESQFNSVQSIEWGKNRFEYRPESYARAWFSAEASGIIRYESEGLIVTWPVRHEIKHRVLGVEVVTSSEDDTGAYASDLGVWRWIKEGSPRLRAFVGINNGLTIRLNAQEVTDLALSFPDLGWMPGGTWHLGSIRGGLAVQRDHWTFSLDSDFVAIKGEDEEVHIRYPHLRLAMKKPAPFHDDVFFPDYDLTLGVNVVSLLPHSNAKMLRIEGLGVTASQSTGTEKLDAVARLNIGRVALAEQVFAPIETYLRLIRLDYRGLAELLASLGWDDPHAHLRPDAPAPKRDRQEIMADILGSAPEVQLGLLVNTDPKRQLRLDLSLDVVNAGLQPVASSALDRVRLEGGLALGAQWWQTDWVLGPHLDSERLAQWVELGLEQGWFVAGEGDEVEPSHVTANALLLGGRLQINNRDQTLLAMLLLLSQLGVP